MSQSLFSAANLQVFLARVHAACGPWWHGQLIVPFALEVPLQKQWRILDFSTP
jgi:hypothetical protein